MARNAPTPYSMAPANRAFIGNFSQQPLGNLVWVIRPGYRDDFRRPRNSSAREGLTGDSGARRVGALYRGVSAGLPVVVPS
jgi:hypothetical protein